MPPGSTSLPLDDAPAASGTRIDDIDDLAIADENICFGGPLRPGHMAARDDEIDRHPRSQLLLLTRRDPTR